MPQRQLIPVERSFPGLSLPSMGDVVSSHLDEAKREIVAGEELFPSGVCGNVEVHLVDSVV